MRESLRLKCETLIANEVLVKKAGKLEYEVLVKLGGLLFLNRDTTPDPQRIKDCGKILKERAGAFSNFRGVLAFVVKLKMSLADNPAAYLDDVMRIYDSLKEGRKIPGEMVAMAAMTIRDNCPVERAEEVAAATREAWQKIRATHPILTDDDDLPLVALMCMAGMDADSAAQRAEETYDALLGKKLPKQTAQSCAMVLALSEKPTTEKADRLIAIYEACRATGHATSRLRDKSMSIYAAYADTPEPADELAATIGEVDDWLRKQKGYGPLGVGNNMRRVIAAALVLQDHDSDLASSLTANTAAAVTQTLAEAIVLTLIMVITISVTTSIVISN